MMIVKSDAEREISELCVMEFKAIIHVYVCVCHS
jgi:hypothetical protein